ncbi:MAG: Gfo/Idh/MocA family oxidoreductase [Clostridia bacterium]
MIKVAIIGIGNRGRTYGKFLNKNKDVQIVALCEKNQDILLSYAKKWKVNNIFTSDAEFFACGKFADALVISTMDKDHFAHAMSALNVGYNLLLEKPVSPSIEECQQIANLAKEKNLKVVVCHVLRYAPYYRKIKEIIESGAIGKITHINHTENVGYWHFSHSYVRGNWRRSDQTTPSILAKCCHDADIIYWFTGKRCLNLTSQGKLEYFTKANKPSQAPHYCLDGCKYAKSCPYEARKIYYGITKHTFPYMIVNAKLVTGSSKPTLKLLKNCLKTSPYGRCVFDCDNNVMEQQVVNMQLEDDITSTLAMTAFSKKCYRKIHIYGTKGEIFGNDISGKLTLNVFAGKTKIIRPSVSTLSIHDSCDKNIINQFVNLLCGRSYDKGLTFIDTSLESHKVTILADEARISGLKVTVNKDI